MKQYIKDGIILPLKEITLWHPDGSYTKNITRETAVANGWQPYEDPETQAAIDFTRQTLSTSVTVDNATALRLSAYLPQWDTYIGGSLRQGQCVTYGGRPWRVRQDIPAVLENQAPGVETAALYERIDEEHEGTAEDPIPYEPPMEIFSGKYYTEGGILYLCTRDSGTALTHTLAQLTGLYVETVQLTEQ